MCPSTTRFWTYSDGAAASKASASPASATPHVFRHPFAALIHPHTDIKTLQTIMGHSDIETTLDRYTHFVHENIINPAQVNPYCDKQHPANPVISRLFRARLVTHA